MSELTFAAPGYALLQATTPCWKCGQATPVTTVWVPSFIDNEDVEEFEDEPVVGGTATLRYIEMLDDAVAAHVQDAAPWLKPERSGAAGATYWANHCQACNAIQGDHFVFGVDGPFFPQSRAEVEFLQIIYGRGPLASRAYAAQSGWMDWIVDCL